MVAFCYESLLNDYIYIRLHSVMACLLTCYIWTAQKTVVIVTSFCLCLCSLYCTVLYCIGSYFCIVKHVLRNCMFHWVYFVLNFYLYRRQYVLPRSLVRLPQSTERILYFTKSFTVSLNPYCILYCTSVSYAYEYCIISRVWHDGFIHNK